MRSSSVGISVSEILSKPVVEAVKGTPEPEAFFKALICTPLADEIAGEEANDEPDHEPCDGPEGLLAHSSTSLLPHMGQYFARNVMVLSRSVT